VHAVLVDPVARRFDRAVIEPAHRVAVGQFVAAERIERRDEVLIFNGYLAFVDLQARAEVPEWTMPRSRTLPTLKGSIIPVEGLVRIDADTVAVDCAGETVGPVVGISFSAAHIVDALLVRIRSSLRSRDVKVSMADEVAELGDHVQLLVKGEVLHRRTKS